MQSTKDLYKLLGLSTEASQDDIRKAHRKLARQYHPDANPEDPRAEERFKEVQQAYEVLSNPQKRREYDQGLRATTSSASRRTTSRAARPTTARRRAARSSGGNTRGNTSSTIDLSGLLGKLANLSSVRADGRKEDSLQLQGEDIARIAKHLGVDMSSLSKLLGEHIKVNAKVSFGESQASRFPTADEHVPGSRPSGVRKEPQEKRAKGPSAQRKGKND